MLPSLSSLLSYLPTVSLPPLIPLPSNLQQRLVSFLLRKSLGGIVKGGLDSDRIEADIRDGSFAINEVEIDQDAIAPFLASTPTLSFVSGTIACISAKVSYPLAQLSLTASEVEVVLRVRDQADAEEWLRESTETLNPISPSTAARDASEELQESIVSIAVAQDFLQHELSPSEDAALKASLHLSPSTSQSDLFLPGAFGSGGGRNTAGSEATEGKDDHEAEEVETTMLAGLIDRILARLKVRVTQVRVRMIWNDTEKGEEEKQTEEAQNELELRIDEMEYLGDADSQAESTTRSAGQPRRAVKLAPPKVFLKLGPAASSSPPFSPPASTSSSSSSSSTSVSELAQSISLPDSITSLAPHLVSQPPPTSSYRSESASESESDSSGDENDLLAMSQSIADLRTSTASLSQSRTSRLDSVDEVGTGGGVGTRRGLESIEESGGSEMFASATSFVSARSTSTLRDKGFQVQTEKEKEEEEADDENPFTNPDSPPLVSRKVPLNQPQIPAQLVVSLGSLSTPEPLVFYLSTNPDPSTRSKPILEVTSTIPSGWIVALTTFELAALIRLGNRLVLGSVDDTPATAHALPRTAPPSPALLVSVLLKSITLLLAYPTSTPAFGSDDPFTQFWSAKDPSTLPASSIKSPHLRLRLEDVSVGYEKGTSTVGVGDLTLSELTSDGRGEKQGWKTLPILVSDQGLTREGKDQLGGDWVVEGAGLGKDWRIKKASSVGFGGIGPGGSAGRKSDQAEDDEGRKKLEAIKITCSKDSSVGINLSPLHLFLDLAILSRLRPVIDELSEAMSSDDNGGSTPRFSNSCSYPSTSRPLTPAPPPLSQLHLLADLSASSQFAPTTTSSSLVAPIKVECPLLRIDLRCPAPKKLRIDKNNEDYIRSGIVVIELEQLRVAKQNEGKIVGTFKEINVGTKHLGTGSRFSNFLTISSLSPSDPTSIRPSLVFTPTTTLAAPTMIRLSLPLVHVKVDKRTLDSVQLFADDLSQFFNSELASSPSSLGGSSTEKYREKMIGSRYFGTKSFRGSTKFGHEPRGAERDSESEDGGLVKTVVDLGVTDLVIDLLVPTMSTTDSPVTHLRVLASDVDVSVSTLSDAPVDMRARAEIGDVRIEELGIEGDNDRRLVLARTGQRDLTSNSIGPLIKLAFSTSSDPQTDLKESRIELGLEGFTYHFNCRHLDLSKDLGDFVKAPEGAFEQVVPNELTRLRLRLSDLSLHLTPPTLSSRIVLSLDTASIESDLMPDLPRMTWSFEARGAKLWAIESAGDLKEGDSAGGIIGSRVWKARGFVCLGELETASVVVRQGNGLVLPDFELLVSKAKLQLSLCADSTAAVTTFVDDLLSASSLQSKAEVPRAKSKPSLSARADPRRSTVDLFASVDDNAFERAQSIHDLPEFLGDDVPANSDYLADTLTQRVKKTPHRPGSSTTSVRDRPGTITEDIAGETVRMLSPDGLQITDDWLAVSRCDETDYSAPASRIRLRLSQVDISVHLHEGYDWLTTRRAIEDESKAVRRRLEKIRQLLAEGQTPDATAENASVLMFGSHQLGLPPGANEMAPKDLLAAIDEELDNGEEDRDAVSTAASSWQTFPGGGSRSNATAQKTSAAVVGKGRKRLTRSKAFAIEVNVRALNANFDSYSSSSPASSRTLDSRSPSSSQTSAKVKVDVGSFDIIDNIKTSTWRKFLTEMRPSDGGLVRAKDSPMAKIEIETSKPSGKADVAQDEISLKLKVAPLRLYIDQDALDFLKVFGAFKGSSPVPSSSSASTPAGPEPFFQRVEVLPVKIKLDYKPKRVDYYALKQGKTAELMNFFHFDGSEMVLRHLVVTGVSGTTTLSNLVQDIWTPDVKANQLADVISGIAPVRSVVNVGSGVANLVLLPIEQYRRDGRVVRGLQKGAQAFAKQTTLEAINVGAKLANGTQVILEQAEHVLGAKFSQRVTGETLSAPIPPPAGSGSVAEGETLLDLDELSDEEIKKVRSRYAEQPTDLRQGVESAYKSLGENFKEAAQTILAVPMEVYERSGNEGPVRAVVRAVPIAVLRPMIGASGAVSKALLGLRNTLDPNQQQGELEDKYKPRPSS